MAEADEVEASVVFVALQSTERCGVVVVVSTDGMRKCLRVLPPDTSRPIERVVGPMCAQLADCGLVEGGILESF